jgi:hypothetical protein
MRSDARHTAALLNIVPLGAIMCGECLPPNSGQSGTMFSKATVDKNRYRQMSISLPVFIADSDHRSNPSSPELFLIPSAQPCYRLFNVKVTNRHLLTVCQVVSSPSLMQSGVDNTQDHNMNISLPVFTIHGNHDDPSGPEDLSAVDIISTVHYVNYFGKQVFKRDKEGDLGRICLSPVLIRKVCVPALLPIGNCRPLQSNQSRGYNLEMFSCRSSLPKGRAVNVPSADMAMY